MSSSGTHNGNTSAEASLSDRPRTKMTEEEETSSPAAKRVRSLPPAQEEASSMSLDTKSRCVGDNEVKKRSNDHGDPAMFANLRTWIVNQEPPQSPTPAESGFVHPAVHWDAAGRQLRIHQRKRQRHAADAIAVDDSPAKNLSSEPPLVRAGDVVFRIPFSRTLSPTNLLAQAEACRTTAVNGTKEPPLVCRLAEVYRKVSDSSSTAYRLHHSPDDCYLALFIACHRHQCSTTARKQSTDAPGKADDWAASYFASLPTHVELPRHWSDWQLQSVLGGSPLHHRILQQRLHLQQDFRTLQTILKDLVDGSTETASSLPSPCPSQSQRSPARASATTKDSSVACTFREFDHAMAVVSSRAFAQATVQGGEETTLVPLLDLCNHRRGGGGSGDNTATTTNKDHPSPTPRVAKNLTYQFDKASSQVVVQWYEAVNTVTTTAMDEAIAAPHDGDGSEDDLVLCITYGAQSNGALLLNYGFSIPDNFEPDGSSNDIYELSLGDPQLDKRDNNNVQNDIDGNSPLLAIPESKDPMETQNSKSTLAVGKLDDPNSRPNSTVVLRVGPKSYTYTCLVKAVEALTPRAATVRSESGPLVVDVAPSGSDGDDDMEAFLNEQDERMQDGDDDDDDDDMQMFLQGQPGGVATDEGDEGEMLLDQMHLAEDLAVRRQQRDTQGLIALRKLLLKRGKSYAMSLETMQQLLSEPTARNSSSEYYAAVLVHSELSTLRFYFRTVEQILEKWRLQRQSKAEEVSWLSGDADRWPSVPREQEHIEGLVAAFLKIRHSG